MKASTNLRTKKRGKVPPRLLTLYHPLARYQMHGREREREAHVASKVIYVPPIVGSAILAWNALIATNMTVEVNVL